MKHENPARERSRADTTAMEPAETALLAHFAKQYVWWKSPEQAMDFPQRVIVQVLDIGEYQDLRTLAAQFGEDKWREVLAHAQAGLFSAGLPTQPRCKKSRTH